MPFLLLFGLMSLFFIPAKHGYLNTCLWGMSVVFTIVGSYIAYSLLRVFYWQKKRQNVFIMATRDGVMSQIESPSHRVEVPWDELRRRVHAYPRAVLFGLTARLGVALSRTDHQSFEAYGVERVTEPTSTNGATA